MFEAHGAKKEAERVLDKARVEFFELATAYCATEDLDRQTVQLPFEDWLTPGERIARDYPGYRILEEKPGAVVIEEDPAKMEFHWTNNALGYTFGRQVRMVKGGFDVDALMEYHDSIASEVVDEVVSYYFNEEKAVALMADKPEIMPVLQKYAYEGKPQLVLATPKKVKDDD